jgi:hypothetical protein
MSGCPSSNPELGRAQQASALPGGVITETRGALESGHGDRGRSPLLSPSRERLEFGGDGFVGADYRCRSVPRSPLGLQSELVGKGLVRDVALRDRGLLAERRAHERIAELDRRVIDLHEPSGDGRRELVDRGRLADHRSARGQHFAQGRSVVERGHQEDRARRRRQVGKAGYEGTLEPGRER